MVGHTRRARRSRRRRVPALLRPATIHASCEDYRAGATIDLTHDRTADGHFTCPLLVLWNAHGIGTSYDVLATWREQAPTVRGRALDCGHFLAEERAEETVAELEAFLADR
jgi:haloacetate dehalogenase